MIFELVQDFSAAISVIPKDHPRHRILTLLEEAIRRDIHFIDRHPTTLFQCMWNTCWWYDCSETGSHYKKPEKGWQEPPPWQRPAPKLHELLATWRSGKFHAALGFTWLRSLRPPSVNLGAGLVGMFFTNDRAAVASVAISPDESCIAVGLDDGAVQVWETKTGRVLWHRFVFEDKAVKKIAFSSNGHEVVTYAETGIVSVLSAGTGDETPWPRSIEGEVMHVAFTSNRWLAGITSADGMFRLVDLQTDTLITSRNRWSRSRQFIRFDYHTEEDVWGEEITIDHAPEEFSVSPCGRFLAEKNSHGYLDVWDLDDPNRPARVSIRVGTGIFAISRGAEAVVTATNNSMISDNPFASIHFLLRNIEIELAGHSARVNALAFSLDRGDMLASGADDGTVRLWDINQGSCIACLSGHNAPISAIAFWPKGKRVLCATRDGRALVWETHPKSQLLPLRDHTNPVAEIALSPDGTSLATDAGEIIVWNTRNAMPLHEFKESYIGPTRGLAFTPEGKVLVRSSDYEMDKWDVRSGEKLDSFCSQDIYSFLARNGVFRGVSFPSIHLILTAENETILCEPKTQQPIVWFPEELGLFSLPAEGNYVGTFKNHVFFLAIEAK